MKSNIRDYQICISTPHLICYKQEDGIINRITGLNETGSYVIILDEENALEVNLAIGEESCELGNTDEVEQWLYPEMALQAGYVPCTKQEFMQAQTEYYRREASKRVSKRLQQRRVVDQALDVLAQPRQQA